MTGNLGYTSGSAKKVHESAVTNMSPHKVGISCTLLSKLYVIINIIIK
jgi:hypothetical protein